MLAVLLEFNVKHGAEEEFIVYWKKTTQIIYEKFGSLGSKLHRSDNDTFIAYAQWPSADIYQTEQDWSAEESDVREKMRATLVDGRPTVLHKLTLLSDLTKSETFVP